MVVIPAGTCLGPMKEGPIYRDQLESNRTFVNEPLAAMHVNGSHLLQLLEHSLELRHLLLQRDAQPRVSGMQFWVRPRRNDTRIFRPAVLHRGTCRWRPVQSATRYTLVTVPSLMKQSRHLLAGVPVHAVQSTVEGSRGVQNRSSIPPTMTVAGAVWSYAQMACRVEDPAAVVAAILAGGGGPVSTKGGDSRRSSGAAQGPALSSSPVCAAHPPKKTAVKSHARAANRSYHSRLATW